MKHVFIYLIAIASIFIISQVLIVWLNGRSVPVPTIPREPQTSGKGPLLKYMIMGDSTTIAQGATYNDGYVIASARHLAQRYKVTMLNVGVSGATAKDVVDAQLARAEAFAPDVALIAVGANDVTHLTSASSIEGSMKTMVEHLRAVNPKVKIIVTGAPAMDTITRFPWTVQQLALWRVEALNTVFKRFKSDGIIFAPIADETREAFRADSTLFAADKFHPTARGYALWIPVINRALDEALKERI